MPSAPDYFNYPRKEMLEFIPLDCKTLLDVGCARGSFGALVKNALGEVEVWGIDPCISESQITSGNLDHFINAAFSDSLDLPKQYFDVIVFNDSLEHFPDPLPPLEACRSLLKPAGILVCSIPNVRYIENLKHLLWELDWKYEDQGIRDKTHLRFFTKKSILRTLEEADYQVISITGIKKRYWWWNAKRFIPIKLLLAKWIEDINYLQFAIIATPKKTFTRI